MASLPPISHGPSGITYTQSEATAGQANYPFFLTNTTDSSVATGKTIAGSDFRIRKPGGAFGNAAGVVTELTLGWYNMVFAAADLDTLGPLAIEISVESGVDPIHAIVQVVALDLNVATVNPGTGGIVAASFAAGALNAAALAADAGAEIADAVWDELVAGHVTTGSAGLAIQLAAAGKGGNSRLDNFTYDAAGMMTAGRLRIFDNAAHAEASTAGGTAETGTVATYTIACSGANGRATSFLSSED